MQFWSHREQLPLAIDTRVGTALEPFLARSIRWQTILSERIAENAKRLQLGSTDGDGVMQCSIREQIKVDPSRRSMPLRSDAETMTGIV